MKTHAVLGSAALVGVLTLSGCGTSDPVTGTVTGRDVDHSCHRSHGVAPMGLALPRKTQKPVKAPPMTKPTTQKPVKPVPHQPGIHPTTRKSCHTEYELDITTKNGDVVEQDVTLSAYLSCAEGDKYPSCA